MEGYLFYIGKSALAAGIFYLAYWLLFQNRKQFVFNRIYLPASLAVSFIIPLITFTKIQFIEATPTPAFDSSVFVTYLPESTEEVQFVYQWYHYLMGIYLLGIAGFLLHLLLGHIKALSIIRYSRIKELYTKIVNITPKDVHPFSFFNKIVLSEKTLDNPSLKIIVEHENIHVKERHTLDILFTEILFLFQWFNPFAWLLKHAIQNNLEYKTDHQIAQSHNPQLYQMAMVELADKEGIAPFLTALNGSQLKNRIIMMKKETDNKYALAKQLLILPLLAILIMGLSNKKIKTEIVQLENKIEIVVDGKKISKDNRAFRDIDFSKGIDGMEIMMALGIEDKVISNGLNIDSNEKNSVYFIKTTNYVPGTSPDFEKAINTAEEKVKESETKETLFAINNKLVNKAEFEKLEDDAIKSPVVLSGSHATKKYGERVKDAVVFDVQTGNNETKSTIHGRLTNKKGEPVAGARVTLKGKMIGTVTDEMGNYNIQTDNEIDELQFAAVGYARKEVSVNGKSKIDVNLGSKNSNKPNTTNVIIEQYYKVQGKVTDEKGEAVPDVTVLEKKDHSGTITDENGNYTIILKDQNRYLVFNKMGYKEQKLVVAGTNEINVKLESDHTKASSVNIQTPVSNKNKQVIKGKVTDQSGIPIPGAAVVIKGTQTGTVTDKRGNYKIEVDDNAKSLVFVLEKYEIQEIGLKEDSEIINVILKAKDTAVIKLKGVEKQPLFMVNGKIVNDLEEIDPNTIKSISVLKDSSSTAMYGELGKNGVILITLKDYYLNIPEKADFTQNKGFKELFYKVEEMPQFPGGAPALEKYIKHSIKYPAIAVNKGIQGKVYVSFIIDKNGNVNDPKISRGVDPALNKEALRVVSTLPKWKPGKQGGKIVNVSYTVPVNFKLTAELIEEYNKLGLDGYPLKKGSANEGKTKTEDVKATDYGMHIRSTTVESHINASSTVFLKSYNGEKKPLFIVDGVEVENLDKVSPTEIESVDVLKDASAIALYGERARHGAILVTMRSSDKLKQNELPVVLNGKMTALTLNEVDRDLIKNINRVEPEEAVRKYGNNGKNGVFEVTSRNVYTDMVKVKSSAELTDEKDIDELKLRKYLAQRIKYPEKAQKHALEGKIQVYLETDKNGKIYQKKGKPPAGTLMLDEVVVVGNNTEKKETIQDNDSGLLIDEVMRATKLLKILYVPEIKGKTIGVTVKFVLQD